MNVQTSEVSVILRLCCVYFFHYIKSVNGIGLALCLNENLFRWATFLSKTMLIILGFCYVIPCETCLKPLV